MRKRLPQFAIIFSVWIFLFEALSYFAFYLLNGDEKFQVCRSKLESISKYHFDSKLKVIGPKPLETLVFQYPEYTDVFRTAAIKGLEIVLFDDGLNPERAKRLVAIGDSFTRGMGSTDNLRYGWVELVENEIPWLDLINFGNLGTGQIQQRYFYHALSSDIFHEIVLINFYEGNDFLDNGTPFDANKYIANLSTGVDKNNSMQRMLISLNVTPAWESFITSSISSKGILLIRLVLERLLPELFLKEHFKTLNLESGEERNIDNKEIPDNIYEIVKRIKKEAKCYLNDRWTFCLEDYLYQDSKSRELLVKHSAEILNKFSGEIRATGKIPLLIIHPRKEQIYASNEFIAEHKLDLYASVEHLKSRLAQNLPVLDLSAALKSRAFSEDFHLYWYEDSHYTPTGYKVVAQEVTKFILQNISTTS